MRVSKTPGAETTDLSVDLIEKASGVVVQDLGITYQNYLENTVLVWSADSKRVAYHTWGSKAGEMHVYFRNGAKFDEIALPEDLPGPDIAFGKKARAGGVKNYGGMTKPVRWLKSGDLEVSSDLTMLSRVDDRSYTGTLRFTVAFDAKHRASVHRVGKMKTTVDRPGARNAQLVQTQRATDAIPIPAGFPARTVEL